MSESFKLTQFAFWQFDNCVSFGKKIAFGNVVYQLLDNRHRNIICQLLHEFVTELRTELLTKQLIQCMTDLLIKLLTK